VIKWKGEEAGSSRWGGEGGREGGRKERGRAGYLAS